MKEGNDFAEPVLFEIRLFPHRSLGPLGFLVFMSVFGGISFAAGIAFLMMGAWPVLGFFGLDVALVWWAFRMNYRAARAREDIRLTPNLLLVRQVSVRGEAKETSFNPRWVRIEATEDGFSGISRLALVARGIPLLIGSFLPPRQREKLAQALSAALAAAKR